MSALSPDELLELAALKTARQTLITGQRVAKVAAGGRSVEYGQPDLGKIDLLIAALERRGRARRGGAVGFRL